MATERKAGGPVFGSLPMLVEPPGEAVIRMVESKRHPMLLAARELLRREVDVLNRNPPVVREQLEYASAVTALCDALAKAEPSAVVLFTPGFTIRPDVGGYAVYGWHHELRYPGDARAYPRDHEVSWHHYHWTARRAANAWLKRARVVSQRIAAELFNHPFSRRHRD